MRRATFRIEADNAIEQAREKIYSGNVIVYYEGFRVEAEQLRVAKVSHSGVSQDSNTVTGSNVILRQDHPERLVKAEKIEFRPLSGSLVLSRVREFSGENETGLEVNGESQIVLTADSISLDSEL
jgi:lipopolysaccharide export system protein LptA